ncbi:proto-oncogene vav isoform X1 [Xenopus laevis]|uniref:Proto-oncogene vav isoform X1 n=2 Tax=Xenopus laevis TaxID=8355 RepID=A0A8J1ME72_XENLA|nr:proto-oncogene vav isoform X1 [Xenopus laevis]
MELWRHCAHWLIQCRVLPPNHRVTLATAQVCDLAQALRDGVLLCQLLNNLMPNAVNLGEINLRPQMSQFLCLKNIRTFLSTCSEKFKMRRADLFEAFDLFDVRDFAKVIDTLSILSWTSVAQSRGFEPFPTEELVTDEDIYSGLSDQIDDTGEEDEDLYDCVDMEEEEGNEIYEDLMKLEEQPAAPTDGKMTADDMRRCCLQELYQTEEKYTGTLESITQYFMKPLQMFLGQNETNTIFINIKDLLDLHQAFLSEMKSCTFYKTQQNLYQVFLRNKEKFLIYGTYCSQVESATKYLEKTSMEHEGVRMKLEECSRRANNGRFSLRDLLMVPMQRVLKYHLLLQELVKHTMDPTEKENLKLSLEAMRDLAQCVNEVKRDNETLKQITNFQLSIENLTDSLAQYGRPKTDGELKVTSMERKSKLDRYAFLLDRALLICKRKGDTFDLKEFIKLQNFQIRDDSSSDKDNKKWSHMFLLIDARGTLGYELYFKTRELKKKWMEQFEMALSNIYPDNALANGHDFQMFSFEDTATCKACQMLLRGLFFQGYRCCRCKAPAHKECLGRVPCCGKQDLGSSTNKKQKPGRGNYNKRNETGLTKMEACQEYMGIPPPPIAFGPPLQMEKGDIVELTKAEADQHWWEGRKTSNNEIGFFPCSHVKPFVCSPVPDLTMYTWYAGPMERKDAEVLLANRSDGTYLVRQRVKDAGEFAISIKFNQEVKHMKVISQGGLWKLTEKKGFKGLTDLIEHYQQNSLKDCFKLLDTTLQFPFKEPEKKDNPKTEKRMKYFGSARARYDFCARDRTELSLKEGDVIRILNKKGQNGWWKGEVYGKVGWFPANYVEDDFSEYC